MTAQDRRRAALRRAVGRIGLSTYVALLYGATILLGPPWHGAFAELEPYYLGALAAFALLMGTRVAFGGRSRWNDWLLLYASALLIHAVVLLDLAPEGADLPLQVAVVALAALAIDLLPAGALAAGLLGIDLAPAVDNGKLAPEALVMTALPLLLAALPLAHLARAERRRAARAESELRRLRGLEVELQALEEEGGAERISEEGVAMRRGDAAVVLSAELHRLLLLVRRALGGTRAVLFDVDRARETVRPRDVESEGPFLVDCEIPIGKGPVGWVALRGTTFQSPERRSEPADPGYCGKGPFPRSIVAAPVRSGDQVTGVLVVDSPEPSAFSAGDGALLEDFARFMATLLATAGVLRHHEEEEKRTKVLHDASLSLARSLALPELLADLLSLARHIAGFDRAYVVHREEPGGFRVLAADGEGAVASGTVVPGGEVSWGSHLMAQDRGFILDLAGERAPMPLCSDGERGTFRSILAVPMRLKDETVGGLLLASAGRAYRARVQETLEVLVTVAAYAIDNARLYQRVAEMATTDGLTGLYNHRYLQEALARELDRAERTGAKFALALLDIDHFKKLNDTYGHPGGDQVLRTLARVLSATARKSDVVARYGGEEFAVILIDTDGRQAGDMAARIRDAVRKAAFAFDGRSLRVTISVGIASYPDDARAKVELIEAADKALYYGKEHGRDQWNAYGRIKDKLAEAPRS